MGTTQGNAIVANIQGGDSDPSFVAQPCGHMRVVAERQEQTAFNLAAAQMRADDFAAAEATLKSLLASPLPPTASRFVVALHLQVH